jgi:hypothetical protein
MLAGGTARPIAPARTMMANVVNTAPELSAPIWHPRPLLKT